MADLAIHTDLLKPLPLGRTHPSNQVFLSISVNNYIFSLYFVIFLRNYNNHNFYLVLLNITNVIINTSIAHFI